MSTFLYRTVWRSRSHILVTSTRVTLKAIVEIWVPVRIFFSHKTTFTTAWKDKRESVELSNEQKKLFPYNMDLCRIVLWPLRSEPNTLSNIYKCNNTDIYKCTMKLANVVLKHFLYFLLFHQTNILRNVGQFSFFSRIKFSYVILRTKCLAEGVIQITSK